MRLLVGILFSLVLLTGCASPDEAGPGRSPETSEAPGPEDTLPVLGRWQSEPLDSGRRVILTLSDDSTYAATNECLELSGRWELTGGQVVLTPDDDGGRQCGEDRGAPVELPPALTVDGDRLVPEGAGPVFSRE